MNDLEITINGLEKFLQRSLSSRMVLRIFYKNKTLFEIDPLKYASIWFDLYGSKEATNESFNGNESFVIYCTSDEKHYHYSLMRNITQGSFKFTTLKERFNGMRITSYAYFFETLVTAEVFLDFLISLVEEKYPKVDTTKVSFQIRQFESI